MMLVIGLPGSGKSTYIEHHLNHSWAGQTVICFDTLRKAFGHVYHRYTEPQVNAFACSMAKVAFMEGRDVVVDESIPFPAWPWTSSAWRATSTRWCAWFIWSRRWRPAGSAGLKED